LFSLTQSEVQLNDDMQAAQSELEAHKMWENGLEQDDIRIRFVALAVFTSAIQTRPVSSRKNDAKNFRD
jgi:hypothetical protein